MNRSERPRMKLYRCISLRGIPGTLLFLSLLTHSSAQNGRTIGVIPAQMSRQNSSIARIDKSNPIRTAAGNTAIVSTAIFQEDFENTSTFPPAGWSMVNADSGGITGAWFPGNTSVFTAFSGSGYAAANYQGANDFLIDQWLISPPIDSVGSQDTLAFWQRSPDNSVYPDSIEVRLSTTDTTLAAFSILLDYFRTSTSGWVQNKYPLNNVIPAGSTIRVAFRYYLTDAGAAGSSSDYAGIDLVQVLRPQLVHDVTVSSVDFPYSGTKQVIGQGFHPQATVKNIGSSTESSFTIRLQIIPPAGTTVIEDQMIAQLAPGQSSQITFNTYIPATAGTYVIRVMAVLPGDQNTRNDTIASYFCGSVLLAGTFTVGAGGSILTLKNAVDTLNGNIISGDVEFSLINAAYSEEPLSIGPLDYATVVKNIVFRPAPSVVAAVTVLSTAAQPYGIAIKGTSNVTIDGMNGAAGKRNLAVSASGIYGTVGILVQGTTSSNADSTTIRNVIIRTGADSLSSAAGYYGCLFSGYSSTYRNLGNRISNCDVSGFGSVGIAAQWEEGIVIEKNVVHDWKQIAGSNDVCGILLADGAISSLVRGNSIYRLATGVNHANACGIENGSGPGSGALVYNNTIAQIVSSGEGTLSNTTRGILSSSTFNSGDGYYYNSIYLSGTDSSSSASSRASGIEIAGGSDITLNDNIIQNQMTLGGTAADNRAFGIYLASLPARFSCDYNDLYTPGIQGSAGYNGVNMVTLAEWSTSFATYQDVHSISSDPGFLSPTTGNLHIRADSSSTVDGKGFPVSGIQTDIDGEARNTSTPDIGADEFTPGSVSCSLDIDPGWILVSLPVRMSDNRTTDVFPTAISNAFEFEGRYKIDTILTNGKGFWLKFGESQTLSWSGLPNTRDTLDLQEGWNIIGSLTDSLSTASIVQIPAGIVISHYFSYNGTYTPSPWIVPGKGYWVKLGRAGKLVLALP